ncbi:MAG: TonB-dependent receptor [Bacteroidales bacterium]|nr:TonB-dependent receptor [Bacteroidales bacterium]
MTKNQNTKTLQCLYILVMFILLSPLSALAQNITVTGVVTDSGNEPVVGATVSIFGTITGTVTNVDGEYTIEAPANGVLVFQFLGLLTKMENVNGRPVINVLLETDEQSLEEIIVVGYGKQRKVTLTGAVAGVKGDEMRQTKNENPQNMLTGRIAGVRVWQRSAEPGAFANNLDIRGLGDPLVVIDGVPRTTEEFQRLNPNDIEDISVLKDASAAIYGLRSANGVVLVTTKKGSKSDRAKISYNGSYTWQTPASMPKLADVYESMTLYNERAMNKITGGNIIYREDAFEAYRNGTRKIDDWNKLVLADYSPQYQHDVSISGGTDKTQYYMGMGYFYQEGFFKSGDLNYSKYNLRSNISTEIAPGLKFEINLSGISDLQNNPYSSAVDIIRNYWRQGSLYPAYADPENTILNYEGLDLEENTVAKMTSDISGYRKYEKKYFQSSTALNYDFGNILPSLKGLSAKAMFSFDYRKDDNNIFRKEYYQYAFNPITNIYAPKLYSISSPSQNRREMFTKQQMLSQVLLNYNRTFGPNHEVSGLIGWESQKLSGDNFYAQRDLAFSIGYLFAGEDEDQVGGMYSGFNDVYEYAYNSLLGRLNYTFASRYIAEAQFRYDGCSRFIKGNQWGFFPSASVGWRISEEPFFKSISALAFINQFKLRSSYGELGDDRGAEYEWATGFDYPATSLNAEKGYYNHYVPGYILGSEFVYAVSARALPNELITWTNSRSFNIGLDFEAWEGLFGLSFDYFDRHRDGLYARNTGDFPTVIGATAPLENLDSDRHFGMDLELSHRHHIGAFMYKVRAIGTITRRQYLTASQQGPYGNSYEKWRHDNLTNRYQGIQFGYEAAGRYENWEDIRTYDIYKEKDILPGDYKYLDWNGDGEINGLDEHPFAYDQTPWLNYSLGFDCSYKKFDMNFLLQGSALGSMEYREPLYQIWGGVLEQYLDRWHPVDPLADPYDPATEWASGYYAYTGRYPRGNSEFNRVSTAYLRLKSVELGYTMPKVKVLPSMSFRVYANAYNIFTITRVKFVDHEHPDSDLGRLYPLNKTYTLGISASF